MAVLLFLAGVFSYWFAVADRYRLFLYYHDMGPLVADTSPFSRVTASRYWMSGLVWAGAVMALYVGANWIAGRISQRYRTPAWWQVWALCAAPLLVIAPLITMTANEPILPASNAGQVTLAVLAGLALALAPGRMAATRPADLLFLTLDGVALMLILTAALGIERVGQLTSGSDFYIIVIVVISAAAGLTLLFVLGHLRLSRGRTMPSLGELIVSGFCVAYLLMPLLHHAGFTDGYYYISDADNFFVRRLGWQLVLWLALILLAAGVSWQRQHLQLKRHKGKLNDNQNVM